MFFIAEVKNSYTQQGQILSQDNNKLGLRVKCQEYT